jgi:hypothetical protein
MTPGEIGWFQWGVSQEVTGILQWLGTMLAVFGIPATYLKSRKAARSAAAAALAVKQFSQRERTSTVAHCYSHLGMARGFIMQEQYPAAASVLEIVKRDALQTIAFFEAGEAQAPENIVVARRNMATIEVQIAKAARSDPAFKAGALDRAVAGLGSCLLDWESRLQTLQDVENAKAA